ncbi:MAG: carbonic anhydrase family protein [Anaerolineae bacterium]|nr:carbonic anhydrase family protein [Anaerolineae bacterium]
MKHNPFFTAITALSFSAAVLGINANQSAAMTGTNATPPPTPEVAIMPIMATDASCATPYVIKKGETLAVIAKRNTGNLFDYVNIVRITNEIARTDKTFKPITNINIIQVGQKICLAKAKPVVAPVVAPVAPAPPPHWEYSGATGPAKWGDLSSEFAACKTGQEQSPIDLSKATLNDVSNIHFAYQPSKINILNNGHTIQVNYDAGSYIVVDGKRYDLLQYHFHAPSEHSINGKLVDAEVHFVHKAADGQLAVVGVLIVQGPENAFLKPVWDNLPTSEGPVRSISTLVDALDLLPPSDLSYRYNGSLTTPPCSEGVKWHVMTQSIQISAKQLKAFTDIFPISNRPIQPRNTRNLVLDVTP